MKRTATVGTGFVGRIIVLYDAKCGTCQTGVSWLRVLDREALIQCMPIEAESLQNLHPALRPDACHREMHVVTPDGTIVTGWDALMMLARLFRLTRLVGVMGGLCLFRWLGRKIYAWLACHRYAPGCTAGQCDRDPEDEQVKDMISCAIVTTRRRT